MVKIETKVLYLVIGAAIMWLFFKGCSKPELIFVPKSSDTIIYKDKTVYIDTGKDRSFYYPADSIKVDRLLTREDSLEITRRMYYSYFVTDSFAFIDSLGTTLARGLIEDSLFGNRIQWRRVSGRIDRPYMTVNNVFEPLVDYRFVNLGGSFTTNGEKTIFFIDGLYQDKKGNGFGFGYGLPEKVIKFGYYRRIFRFK